MRFVPTSCLRPGMVVGRDLYGKNSELMLAEGSTLSELHISRLKCLKYQGIYIHDEISADIEVKDVIDCEVKHKLVGSLKDVFIETKGGGFSKKMLLI